MLICDNLVQRLKELLAELDGATAQPAPRQRLAWDTPTQQQVAHITGQSPIFSAIFTSHTIKLISSGAPFSNPHQIAQAGRDNDGTVVIKIMAARAATIHRLAFVLLHEYVHAKDIHVRDFAIAEAVPYLSKPEYRLFRWQSELGAFQGQLKMVNQVISAFGNPPSDMPADEVSELTRTKEAMELERAGDPVVRMLHVGRESDARRIIKDHYSTAMLDAEHADAAPDTNRTYEAAVTAYKSSPDWPSAAGW
ncbi:hypothetical protein [Halomonas sp. RA08-2]|uniref:hypothetical protein n=1 Tax=Halomonas sp. RA08-2 TaxID=3440842 RepID=UPI003EF08AB2